MTEVNYATNLSQRTPCILVLDSSTSMGQKTKNGSTRIQLLNEGIITFHEALNEDEIALSRVQIAAVNVGGPIDEPEVFMDWTDATEFQPFQLTADGLTPLGAGVRLALSAIETHKENLRSYGISYTRPWMFILTDGAPSEKGDWLDMCSEAREAEASDKVQIFPIGVGEADMETLAKVSPRPPLMLDGLRFRELFVWLSASLGQVSRSVPGTHVDLPSTDPWAAVKL